MPRTVLLADDSVTAQNMGRRILTDAGYEVITVNNGSAALKKIHESRPDLIVLDVYMPGYGGLEVCQRLKESDATMKIPVLLTVGKMEPFKTEEAKRVRADGHIIKPFDASELLAALTKLEDRIVPQSETVRGRGKADSKRSKSSGRDAELDTDGSRNDQISYLKQRKERQAIAPPGKEETEAARGSRPGSLPVQETAEDAVAFAAGPIFDPKAWTAADKNAPEFPVETEVQAGQAVASARETVAASAASEPEKVTDPAPASEIATSEPVATQEASPEAPTEAAEAEPEKAEAIASSPRWVAENVEMTAEEASRSLDAEMRQAQAAEEPAASEQPAHESAAEESRQPVATSPTVSAEKPGESTPEPESTSGAAFAAAASATASSGSTDAVAASASQPEPPASSEGAAAWNEWERIRDSVVNQQTTEAIVQSAAAMIQASQAQSEPAVQGSREDGAPVEASSAQQRAGGDALSSIVDTVLAELKPRLLAEIAKQIAADKK